MSGIHPVRALIIALTLALGVAACGGSSSGNGLESKSAAVILKDTTQAADSLRSVHIAGSMTKSGTHVSLDLHLLAGVGVRGSMSEQGKSFQMVVDHGTAYINASPAFWTAEANATVARLMKGHWLKTVTTGSYASLAQFASIRSIIGAITNKHGKVVKTATRTVNGVKAIGLRDSTQGGILYVALTGKPYPLELTNSGATHGAGNVTFSDFNGSVSITPPKNALDLQQLQKLAGG
jgi:hypothetical protein